jgi:hypothetical protein
MGNLHGAQGSGGGPAPFDAIRIFCLIPSATRETASCYQFSGLGF